MDAAEEAVFWDREEDRRLNPNFFPGFGGSGGGEPSNDGLLT
jgi:hypothetical protein